MLQQVSDYLFMGSLIFLVISCLIVIPGSGGASNYLNASNTTGALTDLQMNHDHKKAYEMQDKWFFKLLKSYLFWIPVTGMVVSVILSKI